MLTLMLMLMRATMRNMFRKGYVSTRYLVTKASKKTLLSAAVDCG
jgi:hypothetical protein